MSIDDQQVRTTLRASGAELRRLRAAASLTQAALAERASISLRTLRNIESGALTPQRSSLDRIATALGLPQTESFVALWHVVDDTMRADDDLFPSPIGFDRFLSPAARLARSRQHTVSRTMHAHLGPTGLLLRSDITDVVQALATGLDRIVHVTYDYQPLVWERVKLTDLHNCHLITSRVLPDADAKYFEVGLGVALEAQETQLISYTVDYTDARGPGAAAVPDRVSGVGVRESGSVLTLQVEFHPAWRPAEIHYEHTMRTDTAPVLRRPLRLNSGGVAQFTLTNAATGLHSITWTSPA